MTRYIYWKEALAEEEAHIAGPRAFGMGVDFELGYLEEICQDIEKIAGKNSPLIETDMFDTIAIQLPKSAKRRADVLLYILENCQCSVVRYTKKSRLLTLVWDF